MKPPLMILNFLSMALVAVPCASSGAEDVLWAMDLGGYEEGSVPELGPGLQIYTENGTRMLRNPEKNVSVRFPKNILPPRETKDWNNIVFQVRYREQESSWFPLIVKKEGVRSEVRYLWYYVVLLQKGIKVLCHGVSQDASIEPNDPRLESFTSYEEMGEAPLSPGEWITAEARVGEEVIKISVKTDDGSNRQAEFKTFPGTGGVQLLALNPVDVAVANVRAAEAPVEPSHPAKESTP